MIKITNKINCCGCASCVQRCPLQCISLQEDNEGFLYPIVDSSMCVNCGQCELVCPIIQEKRSHEPIKVYAAINKDEKIRYASSSGGIFTLLAEYVIGNGGVVFGARFDENWEVCLDYSETMNGISAFRGSKYVQARVDKCYCKAEDFLKRGRLVLFTGTPCQIAGLKQFIRKEYDNLITVDFICHGVPSPKIWKKYLNEHIYSTCEFPRINVDNQITNKKAYTIVDIAFRNKSLGWKDFSFMLTKKSIEVDNNKKILFTNTHRDNSFMQLFLNDVILRPSCYNCHCKDGKSGSDLTIADFWGIEKIAPEMDDNKGTSLVIIQSLKGSKIFNEINLLKKEFTYKDIMGMNKGLQSNCIPHERRDWFWGVVDNTTSLKHITDMLFNQSIYMKIKRRIKNIIKF